MSFGKFPFRSLPCIVGASLRVSLLLWILQNDKSKIDVVLNQALHVQNFDATQSSDTGRQQGDFFE